MERLRQRHRRLVHDGVYSEEREARRRLQPVAGPCADPAARWRARTVLEHGWALQPPGSRAVPSTAGPQPPGDPRPAPAWVSTAVGAGAAWAPTAVQVGARPRTDRRRGPAGLAPFPVRQGLRKTRWSTRRRRRPGGGWW